MAHRRGINPQSWFYGFSSYLAARTAETRRILAGPAAEHWLAAELYGFLATQLPSTLSAYGENQTTDLTINDVAVGDPPIFGSRVCSIEVKVVYPTYPAGKARRHVKRLTEQVEANRSNHGPLSVGVLFGAFAHWPTKPRRNRKTLAEFLASLDEACAGVPFAKPLATLLDEAPVAIGGVDVPVGLVGQFFVLK